jgi:hypothetical protein
LEEPKLQLAVAKPRLPQATLCPLDQPRAFCKTIVKTADAFPCHALPGQKPRLRSPVLRLGGVAVAGQGILFGPCMPTDGLSLILLSNTLNDIQIIQHFPLAFGLSLSCSIVTELKRLPCTNWGGMTLLCQQLVTSSATSFPASLSANPPQTSIYMNTSADNQSDGCGSYR